MNMPEPTMPPMTTMVASNIPRRAARPEGGSGGSGRTGAESRAWMLSGTGASGLHKQIVARSKSRRQRESIILRVGRQAHNRFNASPPSVREIFCDAESAFKSKCVLQHQTCRSALQDRKVGGRIELISATPLA